MRLNPRPSCSNHALGSIPTYAVATLLHLADLALLGNASRRHVVPVGTPSRGHIVQHVAIPGILSLAPLVADGPNVALHGPS